MGVCDLTKVLEMIPQDGTNYEKLGTIATATNIN
jgi:hypothetical protein